MDSKEIPGLVGSAERDRQGVVAGKRPPLYLIAALTFARSRAPVILATSIILLVPCVWQQRIGAGDLLSHTYNAWLASLIQQGKAPGLWIAQPHTNVLFDLVLNSLFGWFGIVLAEKLAVMLAVLVFFWGAFSVAAGISQKAPWFLTPCLAILAYGYVFQMGLFNYYLSVGLSSFAFALLWSGRSIDAMAALPLLILAWLGQPLPVLWALAATSYVRFAHLIQVQHRIFLFVMAVAVIAGLGQLLRSYAGGVWEARQGYFISGADQVVVFRKEYLVLFLGIAGIWGATLFGVYRQQMFTRATMELPLQLYALVVAAGLLLPNILRFAWYKAPYGGVTQRLSLIAAVLMCALVAGAKPARWQIVGFAMLFVFYFALLYQDARTFNHLESRLVGLLDQLPSGERVVGDFDRPHFRGYDLNMLLDHACIRRCFSYANYEASTQQFRIRANPGNTIVTSIGPGTARQEFFQVQSTLPLYEIYACGSRESDLCVRAQQPKHSRS
jgi:hypothetical protein